MDLLYAAIELDSEKKPLEAIVKYKDALIILRREYLECVDPLLERELENVLDLYSKRLNYLRDTTPKAVTTTTNTTTTTPATTTFEYAIVKDTGISWGNVIGLESIKTELRNSIILPLYQPGAIQSYKGVLLFGPPGTGKSLLAKALATESKRVFISISSSDLINKYMGESEQRIKSLFTMAKQHEPSIIFIDEIDSIGGARTDEENDSAMRRVKTELLSCMDGMVSVGNVIVIGATNTPNMLDAALKRRFERKIYIPPPSLDDLCRMIEYYLPGFKDAMEVATHCKPQTTGADVAIFCKAATLHIIETIGDTFEIDKDGFYIPSENGSVVEKDLLQIPKGKLKLRDVTKEDLLWVLENKTTNV